MIVSAGAALTAAVLLIPGTQSAPAPPFNPEESSGTITKNDPQDDVDKDVVNDLADEWSTPDDSTQKNDSNGEEDVLPPDEQQDLSAMTDNDLTIANGDDDDILLDNEKGDSVFITTEKDDGIISTEENDEAELIGSKSYDESIQHKDEESVDSLVDDSAITTGAEENEGSLSEVFEDEIKETAVEEEDFTSLGDELDPLVTDSMPEELNTQKISSNPILTKRFKKRNRKTANFRKRLKRLKEKKIVNLPSINLGTKVCKVKKVLKRTKPKTFMMVWSKKYLLLQKVRISWKMKK